MRRNGTVTATIKVGQLTGQDGRRSAGLTSLYVANQADGTVSVVDPAILAAN